MPFQDHFSRNAQAYAAFRPRYPDALFAALAALAPDRRGAWDCATGSGQAAVGLAAHFEAVTATDASARQIAAAAPHPRITYRVAPAEASGLPDGSVSLVTVAQALHWLDLPAFYGEARRVLVPDGALAVWCYGLCVIGPAIDAVVGRFYGGVVGPYWAPQRALVEQGYRGVAFPFEEVAMPALAIEADLTLAQLAGYVRTWSATQRCAEVSGVDPVEGLVKELEPLWTGPAGAGGALRVRWPLAIRAGLAARAPRPPSARRRSCRP